MKKNRLTGNTIAFYFVVLLCFALYLVYMSLFEHNQVFSARSFEGVSTFESASETVIPDPAAPAGVRRQFVWTLSDTEANEDSLAFYLVHHYAQVWFDDELVYSLTPGAYNHIGDSPSSNWVILPLEPDDSGRKVTVLQSSSASVGILQALSTTGAISWSAAIPIILGQNIGTTVTSMISCVGASKAAKRTALSHLYFNVIGTVLFTAGVLVLKSTGVFTFWSEAIDKSGIANFHTLFNVVMTLVFIPFTKLLEKLCMLTVPSDGTEVDSDVSALDEHLLVTPSLAIQAAGIINSKIANLTSECVAGALSRLGGDKSVSTDRINELYTAVMRMNEALNAYLLKIAECELSEEEAKAVTGLLTRSDDCHHIAQHAISISDTAGDILAKGKGLTPGGKAELDCLSRAVLDLCISAMRCSSEQNRRAAAEIEPFCAVVGEMTELISSRHTARLKSGECSYEAGSLFVGTLIDVERIAKHCSNIGVSLAVQYRRGTFSEEEFVRRIHRGDTEHFVEHYIDYKNKYYSPLTAE